MSHSANGNLEQRVLVLAATKRDGRLTEKVLQQAALPCCLCDSSERLLLELDRGASAVLLAEELVVPDTFSALAEFVRHQPPWSDLPLLLLTSHGANSPGVTRFMERLGNVTLIERPTRINSLISALRSAIRARNRQYEARDHLAEQERTAELLREADSRKNQFLATLAHELRNPLAPIRNSLHILQMTGQADEANKPIFEMMDRQIDHMVRLVDDLLELSRITRGQIELRHDTVHLQSIIENAEEISRPYLRAGQHKLAMSLPAEPLYAVGDPTRLIQVVANLLNNAAKYTNDGGRIAVSLRADDRRAVISVKDNGIGISPEMQPHVFDMFAQVDRSARRTQGGLGIGLTLVRTLVELHGGAIEVHSAGEGQGSEFVVRLPLVASPAAAAPAAASPSPNWSAGDERVLVVDDNRDAAKSLGLLLKLHGANVEVVNDGPAALKAVEAFHPRIVFLDLGMPGMDGFEVAERIRNDDGNQNLMLVALTGWGQEEDRRRTHAAGFNGHLVKPPDIASLKQILASVSNGKTS